MLLSSLRIGIVFQSTRPRGRTRLVFGFCELRQDQFQSTRPRGRTRRAPPCPRLFPTRFNPRVLAGGRDRGSSPYRAWNRVSIHASSREDATRPVRFVRPVRQFQSTRPRGRTRPYLAEKNMQGIGFNPRVLAGGRDFAEPDNRAPIAVSIHASSREDATY